jgi:polyisoprenoid-binding protein YceI
MTTISLPAPGRWTVDAAATRLELETTFRGIFSLRGRFTEAAGHLDVGDGAAGCRIRIDVATAPLTTGSATRDAMLAAAGPIDPSAGPLLRFRSSRIVHRGPGLVVDGVVATDRAAAPLRLVVDLPRRAAAGGITLRARGRIDRETIGALLTRPGVERLLGPAATVDLTVAARPTDLTHRVRSSHTLQHV